VASGVDLAQPALVSAGGLRPDVERGEDGVHGGVEGEGVDGSGEGAAAAGGAVEDGELEEVGA